MRVEIAFIKIKVGLHLMNLFEVRQYNLNVFHTFWLKPTYIVVKKIQIKPLVKITTRQFN